MSREKIYIVHGWTYSLSKWDKLIAVLEQQGFEPVMLKVPGLSLPSDRVWDIPGYVQWLDGELANAEHPIIVGHSNGGRIAMAFDVAHPGKISKLILVASAGVYHESVRLSSKRRLFKLVATLLKPLFGTPLRKLAYRLIGASDYGNASPNMRETMRNVINFDKDFDLQKVTAPTTFIWGENDTATPLEDASIMQHQLPNAT